MRSVIVALALFVVAFAAASSPARGATPSLKKGIWGPVSVDGVSQFPIYRQLGVGIFEYQLRWRAVAPSRPQEPTNPADPAYQWPAELDQAISEARASGIEVMLLLDTAPPWANGGKAPEWAAKPQDFADYAQAAARRYPNVRHWMIYDEPSRQAVFMPLTPERRRKSQSRAPAPLTPAVRQGPRLYARVLDAAYVALKRVRRSNLVIGGNTLVTGDISALNFIRAMRLPNGRPPRMDLYGHNPFTSRRPALSSPPLGYGFADFSDLDTLVQWVDRYLKGSSPRPLKLFLAEFMVPTDHPNSEFNFYVSRRTQASWLKAALKIARGWDRIYTLGWIGLYDDAPRPDGLETARGLLDDMGRKKPSFRAYKRG